MLRRGPKRLCPRWRRLRTGTAWIFLAGCVSHQPPVVLAPIGPISGGRASLVAGGSGFLKVYSATVAHNDGGITYYPHSPYSIYTSEGKRFKGVLNHVGSDDQSPMVVPLPAGRYIVYAQGEGLGRLTVPVEIAASKVTVVFLEGKGLPEARVLPAAEIVRLPDGRAAGRRAPDPPVPQTQ